MKPEAVQLVRRLVEECLKPSVRHYHPEVDKALKEVQRLLAEVTKEIPYFCHDCHHVWETLHHDEPCPQCEGVEISVIQYEEIQEEYSD